MVHGELHLIINGDAGGGKQHSGNNPKKFGWVRHLADRLRLGLCPGSGKSFAAAINFPDVGVGVHQMKRWQGGSFRSGASVTVDDQHHGPNYPKIH
jgi:hypothetical protein